MIKLIPHKSDKGYQLNDAAGRVAVTLVNPENRSYTKNNYILSFGAYGWTRLRVWEPNLDDALETAAEWLKEHEPGHLHQPDYADACKELEIPFDVEALSAGEGKYCEAINNAEADLTYTEAGYLLAFEWNVYCENPDRSTLVDLCRSF